VCFIAPLCRLLRDPPAVLARPRLIVGGIKTLLSHRLVTEQNCPLQPGRIAAFSWQSISIWDALCPITIDQGYSRSYVAQRLLAVVLSTVVEAAFAITLQESASLDPIEALRYE
jgi:hypothetical protein